MTMDETYDHLFVMHKIGHRHSEKTATWVHVVAYKWQPRDYYGECVELFLDERGQASMLVKLFSETDEHDFRRFRINQVRLEA